MEMEEALHERDELKLRVHSYISEVSRIEKLMATKARKKLFTHLWFEDLLFADFTTLTHRSRRTGTCWSVSGRLTLRQSSRSRSYSKLRV